MTSQSPSPSRASCRRGRILVRDAGEEAAQYHRPVQGGPATRRGVLTQGGILLLHDKIVTSSTCHECIVTAISDQPAHGLAVGDRVVVYIGGDDGEIEASGISAFVNLDGRETFVVPEHFVWARVNAGRLEPMGRTILVERDDQAMHRYYYGSGALLHMPEAKLRGGVSATGADNPTPDGRELDAVTALYARVVARGPEAPDDLARGTVVCFSPSYCSTALQVGTHHYRLTDSNEVYFTVQ